MPLPLPNLDDRRWDDLVEEGRALVPRYAPRWTDHNVHDPGITLIELFAWLSEANIFRLNQVPERHRRKFLALTGFNPSSTRATQALLAFKPDDSTTPFEVPAGAEFEATGVDGKTLLFRALRSLTVSEAKLAAVKINSGDGEIRDLTRDWREGLPIVPLGNVPTQNAALYLGFSELSLDEPFALAFGLEGTWSGIRERIRITREAQAQRESFRPVLPKVMEGVESDKAGQPEEPPQHHSVRLVWEYYSKRSGSDGWTTLQPVTGSVRPGPEEVWDDTRALTLDGTVEFRLPNATAQKVKVSPTDDVARYYLRCRLSKGAYDAPPILKSIALNAVYAEQAVPASQSYLIATSISASGSKPKNPGASVCLTLEIGDDRSIRKLNFLEPDFADIPNVIVLEYEPPSATTLGHITLDLLLVGFGSGHPDQQFDLAKAPIQAESFHLFSHDGTTWEKWIRRDDFDASKRIDFHYVLDFENGKITFGDGERGRVPCSRVPLFASYRWTQGEAGNTVATKASWSSHRPFNRIVKTSAKGTLENSAIDLINATGGAVAEALTEAMRRAVETVHAHRRLLALCAETECPTLDQVDRDRVESLPPPTRAVNLLDIERLALDVPGTRVARARAWTEFHPTHPCFKAPGVVTVVVIPDMPVAKPQPSAGLLRAVRCFLERRRMICTRLEVVGPQYLEVSVDARVRTEPHTDIGAVRERIIGKLNQFLDPRSGGPNGLGWPFGRDIYRSEILEAIDNVVGVDHVLTLSLQADKGEPQCGNLPLCPTWLVTPGDHRIEISRG